ncbi:MAG: hypothetical protein KDA66_18235, partial [Planctomycetaceae bacterium]|nr:hypothetical protein [Planctomycetaceae bacterium]
MSRIITAIVLLASLVSQRSARADDIATPDASGNKPVAVRVDIRAQYALTHPGDPNQGRLLFQDQERTRC